MSQSDIRAREEANGVYVASLTTAGLATLLELLQYRDWSLSGEYSVDGGDRDQRVALWRAIGRELDKRAPRTPASPEADLRARWKALSVHYPDGQIRPRPWIESAPLRVTTPEVAPVQITDKPEPAVRDAPQTVYRRPRKPHYNRLLGLWPDRIGQMAGRIAHWMQTQCEGNDEGYPVCDRRTLERGLHANRHQVEWQGALDLLRQEKAITVDAEGRITLVDPGVDERLPDPFDPRGEKRAKEEKQAKKASRRKRPLSQWVKNRIAEREASEENDPVEW
jgi:hypothetical protein